MIRPPRAYAIERTDLRSSRVELDAAHAEQAAALREWARLLIAAKHAGDWDAVFAVVWDLRSCALGLVAPPGAVEP